MGFALDNGYTPDPIEDLMALVMANINTQFGLTYDYPSFVGTNYYKYFYALIQLLQANEVKTSEIFLKLQQYFVITNEKIIRPVVTPPGLLDVLATAGYVASVKPPEDADAGKAFICVNVDDGAGDYATTKLAINTLIKDSVVAGVITQGDQVSTIVLSNGQAFDFKYSLPNLIPVTLKLTLTISENNQFAIDSAAALKIKLIEQIEARYSLGRNFEPQKYFAITDAPWASSVLLEWDSGGGYVSTIFDADFDDLYTFEAGDVSIVIS